MRRKLKLLAGIWLVMALILTVLALWIFDHRTVSEVPFDNFRSSLQTTAARLKLDILEERSSSANFSHLPLTYRLFTGHRCLDNCVTHRFTLKRGDQMLMVAAYVYSNRVSLVELTNTSSKAQAQHWRDLLKRDFPNIRVIITD